MQRNANHINLTYLLKNSDKTTRKQNQIIKGNKQHHVT